MEGKRAMGELMWRWGMGLLVVQLAVFASKVEAQEGCFKSVFAFGDGIFDTGSVSAVFPSILNYDFPPYGMTFFKKPSGRFSDGRLVVDFLSEALGLPRPSSYLQTVTSDFAAGASFASAYSTIGTVSTGQTAGPLMFLSPFSINVQVTHFAEFKKTSFGVMKSSESKRSTLEGADLPTEDSLVARLPTNSEFKSGLFLFATGAHDLINNFNKNMSIGQIESGLGGMMAHYTSAIRTITTHHGVKNIIVFDVEPLGCQPFLLTLIPHGAEDVDEKGCLIAVNGLVQKFNKNLKRTVMSWRNSYKANIVFLSQYDIKIDLMKDSNAGFEKLNAACCGVPVSPYNVLIPVQCGPSVFDPTSNQTLMAAPCEDPSTHLYWDAMYTTEAANRYVTEKILTGKYFDPPFETLTSCAKNPLT